MAVFNEPNQWEHPLGNNADTSTLPDDAAATAGIASLQKLFQIINATPLEAGGIAPDREDVNALFKYLGDQIFYTQNGGIPSYNAAYDYIPGRVVLYTDNSLYKCIQANGASSTVVAPDSESPLGSDYWKDIENQDSTSLIPNQIITSPVPLTDANLHLLDGALLSGSGAYSDYVDLIAEIYNSGDANTSFCTEAEWQTSNTNFGFCNKFVYDSVANTVRLPKINSEHGALIKTYKSGYDWYRIYQDGWCEQGGYKGATGTNQVVSFTLLKEYIDDKYHLSMGYINVRGARTVEDFGCLGSVTSTSFEFYQYFDINLSWSACGYIDISDLQISPIYEYLVVGTVSKTDIQIDIDNVMADLALKADKDGSNITQLFSTNIFNNLSDVAKIAIAHNAMPSDVYDDLTPANNATYTAPADGYFTYKTTWLRTKAYFLLQTANSISAYSQTGYEGHSGGYGFLAVKKGQQVTLTYSDATVNLFRFIYAVGSESEQ